MRYLLLILLLVTTGTITKAQSNSFNIGVVDAIQSSELSEKRVLNIYLPEGYSDTIAYPVIYLLDGSANEDFIHIAGLMQYLNMYELAPKSIVVGIANVDRRRDFTTPSTLPGDLKLIPVNGGSAKFISFIEKELQPYIQKKYKTTPERTIIGQSLGGLLATEILLNKPQLFTHYIIVSPSLWWNKEKMLNEAPDLLKANLHTKAKVYLSVGTEGKEMEEGTKKLAAILKANKNLQFYFAPFPDESHMTILHRSVYRGFEMLYQKK